MFAIPPAGLLRFGIHMLNWFIERTNALSLGSELKYAYPRLRLKSESAYRPRSMR